MAENNLYEREITGPFIARCGGGTDNDGSMESCISVAELAGGGFALRDTKPEGDGRELRADLAELTALGRRVQELVEQAKA